MKTEEGTIVLVGMMGAGKTTVGRELARRHGLRFIDCDHEIERRTGVRVATIFEIEGEHGFRRRENQVLTELLSGCGTVVATGGGVVLDPANRARLQCADATVVYLNVAPRVLWERTRHDRGRPLLQVADPRARIEELYRERDPLYREVADLVVDGQRGGPGGMIRQVEAAIADFRKVHAHSESRSG